MGKRILYLLLVVLAVLPATAQTEPQTATKDANLSSWLRDIYARDHNFITGAAEKMPEEYYNLRPGPQMEVRTFGQILGHVVNYNYIMCSAAKGERNPHQDTDFEKVTTKAGLVKALNDVFTYCDAVYGSLTEASAMETVPPPPGRWPWNRGATRASMLAFNGMHNEEHYGNLVTYMRIKSIVPPSSERVAR
jgi:uncharacterized damage-inducible protein DinB